MPFQKGNPGGPRGISGRKSRTEELGLPRLLEECWTHEQRKEVIATLHSLATDREQKQCVAAASLLFAYTYGKPTERIEVKKIKGRDEQINSARQAFILAAIPSIQAANPTWSAEELTREAELQFDVWMASLQIEPKVIEAESVSSCAS